MKPTSFNMKLSPWQILHLIKECNSISVVINPNCKSRVERITKSIAVDIDRDSLIKRLSRLPAQPMFEVLVITHNGKELVFPRGV